MYLPRFILRTKSQPLQNKTKKNSKFIIIQIKYIYISVLFILSKIYHFLHIKLVKIILV